MACKDCEKSFQDDKGIIVEVTKSGKSALVSVSNLGRNIVEIRLIILCHTSKNEGGLIYLRPPGEPISWKYPSAFLEPNTAALYYELKHVSKGTTVQAQAEYIEIDGRARSCPETF